MTGAATVGGRGCNPMCVGLQPYAGRRRHRVEQPAVAQRRQLPQARTRHRHGGQPLAQAARLDAHLGHRVAVVLALLVLAQLLLGRLPPRLARRWREGAGRVGREHGEVRPLRVREVERGEERVLDGAQATGREEGDEARLRIPARRGVGEVPVGDRVHPPAGHVAQPDGGGATHRARAQRVGEPRAVMRPRQVEDAAWLGVG